MKPIPIVPTTTQKPVQTVKTTTQPAIKTGKIQTPALITQAQKSAGKTGQANNLAPPANKKQKNKEKQDCMIF